MSGPSTNHAVSAYAPIRRNSFLQDPIQPSNNRLSTWTVGIALVVIRFWKDAKLWRELMARLPRQWQGAILSYLQKWRASTTGVLQRTIRGLLEQLQSQLSPFLSAPLPQKQIHVRSMSGESILCDGSTTQITAWSDSYEDRVRQNHCLIRKVLGYWFGQYEPDVAQKKLWMIAASSTDLRNQVDAEIADLFTPLLLELATAASEPDAKQESSAETSKGQSSRWQQWCQDKDIYGYTGKLAAIIVLDQFSRHIRRYQEESITTDPLPPQSQLDALALRTAQLLTAGHAQEIHCGMVPTPQYIFGLMPYRHASTLDTVQYVQTCVEQAASLNVQLEGMTSRFRKATNRRMAVLQDEARRTGNATTAEEKQTDTVSKTDNQFSDDDILETFPFDADMTEALDHPIVRAIQSFLADRGIYPVGGSAALKPNQKQTKRKQNKKSQNKPQGAHPQKDETKSTEPADTPPTSSIIVSLSGGVDSMVIASVLAYLKSDLGYPHLNIVAIHIDYANRPESKAESDYVQSYCDQKGIRFVVRRIEEVTRGITARDEYEQRARQMRYDMYRMVAKECQSAADQKEEQSGIVGVMLGHHRGDLRENVLSNAHKGCGPLDLSGMTAVSQNDGVTIYRPLLPLEKTEVYDYAHRFGVPYFKDTTPHWSTRGKLRNKLLPLLEEIYGEGSMNNLSTLATESDECRDLLHNALLKPFMDRVIRTPMGIMFETAPFVAQGLFFWKFVLREVLHSAGLGMFSDKSVMSFLERIRPEHTFKKTIREGWLQCRRDYAVYLQGDGKIFVFYPDSFPWRKSDGFKCQEEVLDIEQRTTIAVGPWIVEAEQCNVNEEERGELLRQKAVPSMSQFMQGFVEYYLEVPMIPREKEDGKDALSPSPLVFAPCFNKDTRPQAWKSTDEKIQEVLPLLGLSQSSADDMKTTATRVALVRITLDRRSSSE